MTWTQQPGRVLSDDAREEHAMSVEREMTADEIAEQERQWDEYATKQRAKGLCEYGGLAIHSCHRSICDCFDAWDCKRCLL